MTGSKPQNLAPLALAIVGAFIVVCSCLFGPADIAPLKALLGLFGVGDPTLVMVTQEIRLPRALAAWIAGAALGASGAALQGLLRNLYDARHVRGSS